jgi:PAS domain S-box-containing protein
MEEGATMESGFLDRLVSRLDRIDPESLQVHFLHLAKERGLLETIFHSIQEGVIVIDGEGKITYANRAAERFLGFSLETARGRPVARVLHDIDWDRVLDLDHGEWSRLISREIEVTYPEPRFLNFSVVPIASEHEAEKGAVVMLRDVTRDRQNEASLVESERLNAVKLLAAGVAHEIGNPLNALTIHLQLLEREIRRLPEAVRSDLPDLVQTARSEVSRLDMIITQFLRAIRPTRPRLALSRIEQLLEESLTLLRQEIQDRDIEVAIERPESLPRIRVDRDQIRNAFQAMPDGGVLRIVVSATDTHLAVSFRDSGVGIPPENMSRLFEPYYTTKKEGSGLGLMIVQRIVQDHGGQIEIVSKTDVGTSMTLYLPRADRRVRLLKSRSPDDPADPSLPADAILTPAAETVDVPIEAPPETGGRGRNRHAD